MEQGQWSNLLCLPFALSLLALRRRQDWRAGLWLGLLLLKPQFIPIWAVALLVSGRWKALAGLTVSAAALLIVSTVIAGPRWVVAWLRIGQASISATAGHGFQAVYSHNFRQMFGLLPGVGPAGANALQDGLAILLALGIGGIWWRCRRMPLSGTVGGQVLTLTTLVMLLSSPVLNTHDLTFWVVGAAFLPFTPVQRVWVKLCWAGWITSVLAVFMLMQSPIKLAAVYMVVAVGMLLAAILRGEATLSPSSIAVPETAAPVSA
jgi:hypothetical protein